MPTVTIPAAASDIAAATGTGTYPPPYTSSASGNPAIVKRSSGFTVTVGLIRFNTGPALPDGATVESATLRAAILNEASGDGRSVTADWYDFGGTADSGDYTATAGTTAFAGRAVSSFPPFTGFVPPTPVYEYVVLADGSTGTVLRQVGFTGGTTLTPTTLPLLAPAANVSAVGYTGLRLHISGGQPAGANSVRVYNPELIVSYAETGQAGGSDPQTGGSSNIFGAPYVQPTASRRAPRLAVPWRIELADRMGQPITLLSRIALGKTLSYGLRQPATLKFRVPSDDPSVATIHTDGLPMLHPHARVVRGYRQEQDDSGATIWKLRFAGYVSQLQDAGGPEDYWTEVVCYDPWQRLSHRIIEDAAFEDVDGATIARQLVDQANTIAYTGVATQGGTFEQAPPRAVTYSRQSVGSALVDLASAFDGFDLLFEPVQPMDGAGNPIYNGTLARLHCFAKLGRWQGALKLSWGAPPHNAITVKRLLDGETMANSIVGLGQSAVSGPTDDPDSQNLYGYLQAVLSYSDISSPEFLQSLVAEHLQFRKRPREIVEIVPQPGTSPEPFTHLNLGDTFEVYAGPQLRGGFAGVQRLYGMEIALDDDTATETVSRYVTSPA